MAHQITTPIQFLRSNFLRSIGLAAALSALAMNADAAPQTQADRTNASPAQSNEVNPTSRSHPLRLDDEAWINDIGTLLYADLDGDGYFSGISLSIDADTTYSSFEVFAAIDIISLSSNLDSGRAERLHTTRNFDLYGRSLNDEYRVDIDLIRNYSPGTYALEIALFDARTERLLDRVGANDFRNLRDLPLESEDNQSFFIPVIDRPVEPSNDDIRVVEYAGSTGYTVILILMMSALFRLIAVRRQ